MKELERRVIRSRFLFVVFTVQMAALTSAQEAEQEISTSLFKAIDALPMWPAKGHFSTKQWKQYLETAKLLQITNDKKALSTLRKWDSHAWEKVLRESDATGCENKGRILLRVAFDVPHAWPGEEAKRGYKMRSRCWPLGIDQEGRLGLIANMTSSRKPYHVDREYELFKDRCESRDLSKIQFFEGVKRELDPFAK